MKIEYGGQEKLIVGNGKQISISHIGQAYLPTHFPIPLHLENALLVPQITKNLFSISQLIADNRVFVEFHANCCLVKDKTTGTVLLRGKLKDGLYLLHAPQTTINSQSKLIKPVSKLVNLCRSTTSPVSVKHNCTSVGFSVSTSSLNANIWHQ